MPAKTATDPPRRTAGAPNGSILIVDDDRTFRERLGRALAARGYHTEVAGDARRALEIARARRFDCAAIDLRMPGSSGLELLSELQRIDVEMRVVVLTGYGSIASAVEAMRLGAHGYLSKPADADDLVRAISDDGRSQAPSAPAPTLARAEWEHIERILAECHGNISETSRRLGISRRTLQLKLKKEPPRS